jgi:RNA polymerase sigma-70 factor (ECF subfamily)
VISLESTTLRSPLPPDARPIDTDAALVAAARRDRAAFAPLYLRYVDPVFRYCLRRLGSWEAAEDATAQVFTKALAALPGYRESGSSFRSWLFAIAHNVLVDAGRSARPHDMLDESLPLTDPGTGPEEAALAAEGQREVQLLLAIVPPDQRRVLELRLAGLTTAEIAQALGLSPGAVRASQYRAAKRLRLVMGLAPHGMGDHDA